MYNDHDDSYRPPRGLERLRHRPVPSVPGDVIKPGTRLQGGCIEDIRALQGALSAILKHCQKGEDRNGEEQTYFDVVYIARFHNAWTSFLKRTDVTADHLAERKLPSFRQKRHLRLVANRRGLSRYRPTNKDSGPEAA
jgi:hypothetical protein